VLLGGRGPPRGRMAWPVTSSPRPSRLSGRCAVVTASCRRDDVPSATEARESSTTVADLGRREGKGRAGHSCVSAAASARAPTIETMSAVPQLVAEGQLDLLVGARRAHGASGRRSSHGRGGPRHRKSRPSQTPQSSTPTSRSSRGGVAAIAVVRRKRHPLALGRSLNAVSASSRRTPRDESRREAALQRSRSLHDAGLARLYSRAGSRPRRPGRRERGAPPACRLLDRCARRPATARARLRESPMGGRRGCCLRRRARDWVQPVFRS